MTKYARKILEIVEASRSHPTAEQVYLQLCRSFPGVARATVYNNLNRLCQEGKVRRISVEGQADRYDRTAPHDHLVCRECGRLLDVQLADLTGLLERQLGRPILSYDLRLVDLCDRCREKQEQRWEQTASERKEEQV